MTSVNIDRTFKISDIIKKHIQKQEHSDTYWDDAFFHGCGYLRDLHNLINGGGDFGNYRFPVCGRYDTELLELLGDKNFGWVIAHWGVDDYSGRSDIVVLNMDTKEIFEYGYYYGSCSGCDDWEDRGLATEQIKKEMWRDGVIYKNLDEYEKRVMQRFK